MSVTLLYDLNLNPVLANMSSGETRRRKGDNQTVFVTVGTTQFDKLIQTVCSKEVLQKLKYLGYSKVTLQIGAGECIPDASVCDQIPGLDVEYFKYKPSISEDIGAADLVISHAGAGSVLESLGAGKSLLVVINDDLMGNHQLELAYQLFNDGHLYYCNCRNLMETLDTVDFSKLKPFTPGKPERFAAFLDKMMGFCE